MLLQTQMCSCFINRSNPLSWPKLPDCSMQDHKHYRKWETRLKQFSLQTNTDYKMCTGRNSNQSLTQGYSELVRRGKSTRLPGAKATIAHVGETPVQSEQKYPSETDYASSACSRESTDGLQSNSQHLPAKSSLWWFNFAGVLLIPTTPLHPWLIYTRTSLYERWGRKWSH